ILVRVERFAPLIKLVLSQPPLPIGLHAQEEIRISKFQIRNFIWCRRRDSNPHCLVPKTSASSRLGYAGKTFLIADCRFARAEWSSLRKDQLEIGNHKSEMFWWTWHELNVRPRPSQSRALIPLSYRSQHFRLAIADFRFVYGKEKMTLRIECQSAMSWRRWSDSNAHRISPGTLAGCCHTN